MWSYTPQKLRDAKRRLNEQRGWPYTDPAFDEYKKMARECLLWRMTRQEYLSMTEIEYHAWHEAWEELQKERAGKA